MTNRQVAFADEIEHSERAKFNHWFREEFEKVAEEREANRTRSLAPIAAKGTLDWAYPPFILGTTAAALGWDVSIFFSFYGLELLKKDLNLGVSPLGNPAMPMKMPLGPDWLRNINWNIPNAVMGNMPGFEGMAKAMFESTLKQKGVASIAELGSMAIDCGVNMVACQMTVDLFGHDKNDFVPEINDWVGAASFLPIAAKADIGLFI